MVHMHSELAHYPHSVAVQQYITHDGLYNCKLKGVATHRVGVATSIVAIPYIKYTGFK